MGSKYDDILECVRTVAPSCLADFDTPRTDIPIHGNANAHSSWQLVCRCGGKTGRILGHPLSGLGVPNARPDWLVSPLSFECIECGVATQILDTDLHGYHALEGGSAKIRGTGSPSPFSCPKCACMHFGVVIAFLFWGVDELAEEFDSDWEDRFNAFLCDCTCRSCGEISQPTDFGKL